MYTLARFNRFPLARCGARSTWPIADEFFRPFAEIVNAPMRTAVRETETAYLFDAALPGFAPGEIDVSVQNGVLTINAEHKEGEQDESAFASRSVRRSFTLEGIDEAAITA